MRLSCLPSMISFNTQPPEGGWPLKAAFSRPFGRFNTQPPEGGWVFKQAAGAIVDVFQHTAARRRLAMP